MRYTYRITAVHWDKRERICYDVARREINATVEKLMDKGYYIVSIDRIPR